MKTLLKSIITLGIFILSNAAYSQSPEGINYQATVRDATGNLMTSQSVTVIFAIKQTTATGTTVYQETHSLTTNAYGGFNTEIGSGTATTGTFSSINWGGNSYFLNVTVDGNDLGTTQLISVPYALYAKTSGSSTPGPTGPQGVAGPTGAIGPQGVAGSQGPSGSDDQNIDSVSYVNDSLSVAIQNGNSASAYLPLVFENNTGTIRTKGGYDTANFVFGSPQMDDDFNTSHDSRMIFNNSKAAFRVGRVTGKNWDEDSLGNGSFATGYNSKATGTSSIAIGHNSKATSTYATAIGHSALASGLNSTALGELSVAIGNNSTALGTSTIATGYSSTALGNQSHAIGPRSTATGFLTVASGTVSTAFGLSTTASGNTSTAMGSNTTASGSYSTVMGKFNAISSTYFFALGNGTSTSNRLNAMHILGADNSAHFRGEVLPMISNTVSLGNSGLKWTSVWATNGTVQTSDTTLKTNITPLSYGLADLMKIKTISYNWIGEETGKRKIGFNAQNLQSIIPEVVVDETEVTNEETGEVTVVKTEKLGVYYSDMVPVLTKSIQEQQAIIEKQNKQIEKLQQEMEELKRLMLNRK